jgi:hypothetical protein
MTSESLSAIAGVLSSLAFSYVPGLSDWFDAKPPTAKRLIMAVLLLAVAAGALGLSCANIIDNVSCTQAGLVALVNSFIAALVANQATYLIAPKAKAGA